MGHIISAIRLMLRLPPVWVATLALGWAIWINGQEPLVDIFLYAVQRLFQ